MRILSVTFFLAFAVSVCLADGIDELFHILDKEGAGAIAIEDLAAKLEASGKASEGAATEENIQQFDANGDGKLDATEFRNLLEFEADHFVGPNTFDYFKVFDVNGDGQISNAEFLEDMAAIETALGVYVDQEGINSLFDSIDSNGDGNINLGEFYASHNQVERKGEERRRGGKTALATSIFNFGTAALNTWNNWWG